MESDTLSIKDFEVYVPAKNSTIEALLHRARVRDDRGLGRRGRSELSGHRFRLQDYYVKDWADYFMVVIGVDDVEAWHRHATDCRERSV